MYPVRSARVGAVKHGRKSILVNDHRNTALACYCAEHRIVDTRSELDLGGQGVLFALGIGH